MNKKQRYKISKLAFGEKCEYDKPLANLVIKKRSEIII
jgi:hypothetical protein